ncbi:MAG: DNA-directed RNA polymerase subunit alpha [Spirochaetes bacterium GWF1_31_7]|nr:MAG: DNA-directed RNA polymerase subunit alpha [Spirochaetes bacterium GWE1_32_154]OHD47298.1 MAG: DNA-directed RNA polymerase subunit alpha [Spirochaetes bacterium GWE2_31_10]OHD47357.1 MAG: DNA-directed RNA polymerase subunit alpha [Spirochaetes bacterium GWF1_31_7]OHD74818.1 MAG: DNA-directed RNA polymerase subunit alpha [Spirochaetes bacterium RIFOXYB1_FULL_32_8]HBD92809.1 DNA-directed RNA polymerase subunit alpha [Spirochaetia bacterium]
MNQNLLVKSFTKPKGIQYEKDVLTPNYGKFVIYPFERGFGHTVGNVFRRVLLSSIPGYAITAIRVQTWNDKNELSILPSPFEAIPEVKEDTFDIINNLKNVKIKLLQDIESRTIKIEKKGAGDITALDLQVDDFIEITNKDLHIMTLTKDANISIELQIDSGRGYVDIDRQESYGEHDISTILIDADFSPVRKIKYEVTDTRIGQRSDYDKLIFELWTDGTQSPEDTMGIAAKILTDHFSTFINFKVEEVSEEKVEKDEDQELKQILSTPVEELELSVRAGNCLRSENVRTIGDLVCKTEDEVSKIQHFGKKSLTEIKEKLVKYKLSFGMKDIVSKVMNKK